MTIPYRKLKQIEEIQGSAFMNKFLLLSDLNMCVGDNYKPPILEIPVHSQNYIKDDL